MDRKNLEILRKERQKEYKIDEEVSIKKSKQLFY